jgi:hypothetical protein
MNVASILRQKGRAVTTASPSTTLLEVADKLAAKRIGAIVIIGPKGRVAGIISERDINAPCSSAFMAWPVRLINGTRQAARRVAPLDTARRHARRRKRRALPVGPPRRVRRLAPERGASGGMIA